MHQFISSGNNGKALHWNCDEMTDRMKHAAKRMIKHYHGDPRKIWQRQKSVKEVRKRLKKFSGIGPELSRMAVLILVRDYRKIGGETSFGYLNPKIDVHVKRVFKRTGLIENGDKKSAIDVARSLNRKFPAILDYPAWKIGQEFCHEKNPKCGICKLGSVCKKYIWMITKCLQVSFIGNDNNLRNSNTMLLTFWLRKKLVSVGWISVILFKTNLAKLIR